MDTATHTPNAGGWLARLQADPRRRQIAVAVALSLLIFALLLGGYLMLRPNYIVLFRGLKPLDAAAVVKELEKEKIPYRYDEAANAILVPEGESKATRIKLGSADLRLQDVVGLELFKDSDLGLTEFAQKVNYQRALQGEVARTLMSLEEVDMARVHLTLPESSIFRRDQVKPKASVTIFPKSSAPLGEDSIRGIQKLVAASVPGMAPGDVIVLDQRGAAATADEIGDVSDPKFALKQAIERSYEKKISEQLARVLRETGATVSVNAEINFDQVQTTRETGIAPPAEAAPRAAAAACGGRRLRRARRRRSAAAAARVVGGGGAGRAGAHQPRARTDRQRAGHGAPAQRGDRARARATGRGGGEGAGGGRGLGRHRWQARRRGVDRGPRSGPAGGRRGDAGCGAARAGGAAQPVSAATANATAFAARTWPCSAPPACCCWSAASPGALRRREPAARRLSEHEREEFAARLKRLLQEQGDAHVRP
ncbi:flagellar M-ring protein FliF [Lysobacter enzymogenes]|nr:flagellar basal-body MS-ring/collar protein FliF [Lysobacter enzymogenes]QCW28018.1 flagellar M-ring protein FliF [Lysobacter enzymogenes]